MDKKKQKLELNKNVVVQLMTDSEQLSEKYMRKIAGGKRYPVTLAVTKAQCNQP